PLPTTATLFPYTTLFRSDLAAVERAGVVGRKRRRQHVDAVRRAHQHVLELFEVLNDVVVKGIQDVVLGMDVEHQRDIAERYVQRSEEHTSELQSRENLVC